MRDEYELHNKIAQFLGTRRAADDHLALVTKQDEQDLHDIISALLEFKYARNYDGGLPISYALINKHTHAEVLYHSVSLTKPGKSPIREISIIASA